MKISLHCTCGDSWTGTVTPQKQADRFIALWNAAHVGLPGHSPCSARQAWRARDKPKQVIPPALSDN